MKADENVEKVRTFVRTDCHLSIRMIAEKLNVDKGMVKEILTTNLNMKKVRAKMVSKNLPVFSWKINISAQTHSTLTRSYSV
jgi:hypothetical protein